MLIQLTVRDFALINYITLEFDPKLNVLTGETGAGKSIIIDAVSLLLGARAKSDDVRIGSDKARIEGVFTMDSPIVAKLLEQMGLLETDEDVVVLSREVSVAGKNICRINNHVVTLTNFRLVGQQLINIYGQHDFQDISDKERHIQLLDSLGDEDFQRLLDELSGYYEALRESNRWLKKLRKTALEREERLKYLQFKQQELQELQLKPGEDKTLQEQLERLDNIEHVVKGADTAYRLLYGSQNAVYIQLDQAIRQLEPAAVYDKQLVEILESLRSINYVIEDYGRTLNNYKARIDFDPLHKGRLDERHYQLEKIKKKYNKSLEELIGELNVVEDEIKQLSDLDIELTDAQEVYRQAKVAFMEKAQALSQARQQLAVDFQSQLEAHLKDLAMPQAKFRVHFEQKGMERNGTDEVEFYLSANPGQPLRPLSQIASGGEMSRIMLAFKTILARHESIGTLIFDEIDTGIGGNILVMVADKLQKVSHNAQVICVTHAPQIAALAARHYLITKNVIDENTSTTIQWLDEEAQIHELARMLGGDETYQLQHARALKERKTGRPV